MFIGNRRSQDVSQTSLWRVIRRRQRAVRCAVRARNRQLTADGRHRAGAGSMRLAARYHHLPANPFIRRIGAGVRCDEKQD